jgi:predicted Zn-dependent peptidase
MNKIVPATLPDSHSSIQSIYKKTVLPNGIRIVTEQIPYVRSVSIGVWVNVGSRDENERNNGITHFVEHMVFKGTKRYSTQQIARSLESVGGYLNAFTSKEHTCFYARTLDEYLPKAVDVLSDLVQHPLYNKSDMEKEKFVVLEELKNIEDDPDDLIHDYFDHSVYQKHPLGFPVIGKAENIKRFSKDDLFEYSREHYTPNRMVVAGAGNLKHEEVVDLVEKYFHASKSKSGDIKRERVPKRVHSKKEIFERPISQAHVCLGTIGYSIKSRHRYPLLVLNTLLGEGMSSRLFQNIREKYGFAYNVYSFANLMSDTGNFGAYIGTDNNNIDNSINLILKELEKLKTKPVGNAELKRTKAQLKGTMMLSLESMSSRMMRLGSGEMYLGDFVPLNAILKKIEAVSPDEILETANHLFRMDNFSTVIFKPAEVSSSNQKAA